MLDRHECFSVFHHLQKDKQRKQRHSLKLGKKRRESSKCNYYIISPKVIIKAIIIIIWKECKFVVMAAAGIKQRKMWVAEMFSKELPKATPDM